MFSGNRQLQSRILLATAVCTLLSVPFIRFFTDEEKSLPGTVMPMPLVEGDSDVYDGVWHFWWTDYSLKNNLDPRTCTVIDSPDGVSMAYQHIGWVDTFAASVLGIPPVTAYTLSLYFATMLTALFAYLLAKSWGACLTGSVFTALAIAWMPSRMAHLMQHYQLANIWYLIAALWLCREFLNRDRNWKVLVPFLFAASLAVLQSPYQGVLVGFGLLATAYIGRFPVRKTIILISVYIISLVPFMIMLFTAPGRLGELSMNWREAIYWAAEPQSFILPSPFGITGLITGIPAKMSWMSNSYEGIVTAGLIVLIPFIIFVIKKRRWRFASVATVLYILCLGPELRVFGRTTGIPLPFRLLQFIPGLNGIRAPSRFVLLAGIIIAVGAGIYISKLSRKWKALFMAGIILELFVPVIPGISAEIPAECYSIEAGKTVLEVPVMQNVRRYALFQTTGGYDREYTFLARGIAMVPDMPEVDCIIYHRWLMHPDSLEIYDNRLCSLFPGFDSSDSVWISQEGLSE